MHDSRVNRARFRAWRRGFREADLILGPFADSRAAEMTEAQLTKFEALLAQPDHDLYAWILEQAAAPPEFDHELLSQLRAYARAARASFIHGG